MPPVNNIAQNLSGVLVWDGIQRCQVDTRYADLGIDGAHRLANSRAVCATRNSRKRPVPVILIL